VALWQVLSEAGGRGGEQREDGGESKIGGKGGGELDHAVSFAGGSIKPIGFRAFPRDLSSREGALKAQIDADKAYWHVIVPTSQNRWLRQFLNCVQHRLWQAVWFWRAAAVGIDAKASHPLLQD
jgi:hypothetical protein